MVSQSNTPPPSSSPKTFAPAVYVTFCCVLALRFVADTVLTRRNVSVRVIRRDHSENATDGAGNIGDGGWEDDRSSFFRGLEQQYCRFAQVHSLDHGKHYLDFRRGFYAQEGRWRLVNKMLNNTEVYPDSVGSAEVRSGVGPFQRNMTFVHVGKAGGSSLACNIAWARWRLGKKCRGKAQLPSPDGRRESAISRQVNCYTHYDYNRHCFDVNRSFVVNVRNPIHRVASWYIYEHIQNQRVVHGREKEFRCGQLMLYTCYGRFDELASVGLGAPRPSGGKKLRVRTNLTADECVHWAWAAVQGDIPAEYHNVFNYDWYTNRLLDDTSKEIFVVRIEHLRQDWRTVDLMVGGTGSIPPKFDSPQNDAASMPLVVSNRTVSAKGMRNLCRALCEEIQVYKRLLFRAANLREEDLRASMEELRQLCPDETDIAPRKCPNVH